MLIDLKVYQIPANVSIFRLFLNWKKMPFWLLRSATGASIAYWKAKSNLYFEDGFVGKSILGRHFTSRYFGDLHGKRSKHCNRAKEEWGIFSKAKYRLQLSPRPANMKILIRNNKSQPVSLNVTDQIPISVNSDILVESKELSGGTLNPPNWSNRMGSETATGEAEGTEVWLWGQIS